MSIGEGSGRSPQQVAPIQQIQMMPATIMAIILVGVLLSGCGEPPPEHLGPADWRQPPDEPGPIELTAVWMEQTHSWDTTVVAASPDDGLEPPGFCIAYFEGVARDLNSCQVDTDGWEDLPYSWVVRGEWTGLFAWNEPEAVLHAFDDRGQPMTFWSDHIHEDADLISE